MYEKFSAGTDTVTYLSQKVEGSNFTFFVVHFENIGREGYMLHQNACLISQVFPKFRGDLPVVSCGFG